MNELKRNVYIRMKTVHDHQSLDIEAAGVVWLKGGQIIIRYEETSADLAGVTTMVKCSEKEITLIRHGSIRSHQRFILGQRTTGTYDIAQGQLSIVTVTEQLDILFNPQGLGQAVWAYRLLLGGTEVGYFRITLDVQEDI